MQNLNIYIKQINKYIFVDTAKTLYYVIQQKQTAFVN